MSTLELLLQATSSMRPSDKQTVAAASACLDRFTAAFNGRDLAAMDAELHFPHVMLADGTIRIWNAGGQHPIDLFKSLEECGWAYTSYESREAFLSTADKAHFLVTYTRRRADGEILSTHQNMWILTRVSGRWGIAVRSY